MTTTAPQPRDLGGQYSFKTHNEPGVALTGAAGTDDIRRLHAFADAQDSSTDGRGLANQARLSAAARTIHEELPGAASFTLDKAEGGYVVARAWDSRGYQLGEDAREHIAKHLREAGVGYIHAPVGLTEARNWEPESVSPTSPKITSKGRTVFITLPDGNVVDRTSKTRNYTHAIIGSPEDPELVRGKAEAEIRESRKELEDIDAALAEPLKIRSVKRFKSDVDPDVDYQGKPAYNGFEYRAYSTDGKRVLRTVWGNSKQETQGAYDEDGKYQSGLIVKVFPAMTGSLKERRSTIARYIEGNQQIIDKVDEGTYDTGGWGAWGFSASAASAEKTARANAGYTPTRKFSAVEVDK